MVENIVIALIVASAVAYLGRGAWRSIRPAPKVNSSAPRGGACGPTGCGSCAK